MASSLKNLSQHDPENIPNCAGKKFGLVVSEYHGEITNALLSGATETLQEHGVSADDIFVDYVPGAFEMPLGAAAIFKAHHLDGVICLGCVIKGDTDHDVYINHSVAHALQNLSLKTGKPFIFGLLTPNTRQQALDRSGGIHGNKGVECAVAALKMAANKPSDGRKIGF